MLAYVCNTHLALGTISAEESHSQGIWKWHGIMQLCRIGELPS